MYSAQVDWMEGRLCGATGPITDDWGLVAACSGIAWPRVRAWLVRGHPLSLVALDALRFCWRYDCPVLKERRPKLQSPDPVPVMDEALERYRRADPVPRVEVAVQRIRSHWPEIIEAGRLS